MTSNHEEYSNDITLENLKCSVQIYCNYTRHLGYSDENNFVKEISSLK